MSTKKLFLAFAGAFLAACAESTGPPPAAETGQGPAFHALRWKPGLAPRTAALTRPTSRDHLPALPAVSLSLTGGDGTAEVSFWAVRGEERSVQITYGSAAEDAGRFLTFTVPAQALLARPDGSTIATGDSVLITATLHPTDFVVEFEPTGLVFSGTNPARLTVWYTGAVEDLNDDGYVDNDDEYIEQELLGMWYQEVLVDPWVPVTADHSVTDRSFSFNLFHFSGYAVSW